MTAESIRTMERASIRQYVSDHRKFLTGRVLDFGAGKPGTCREPQPYRDLVNGQYVPYDLGDLGPEDLIRSEHDLFDAVLCTQVIQYLQEADIELIRIRKLLKHGGHLVITGPGCWPEVEAADLFRYTRSGIRKILLDAGFDVINVMDRASVAAGDFYFSLGWGALAVRP